jgi:hypothetical protein
MRTKITNKVRQLNSLKLWSAITGVALVVALILAFLPYEASIDTGGLLSISLSPRQTQAQEPAQSPIRPGFGWAPIDFSSYAGGFTGGQIYNITCPSNINSGSGVSYSYANYTLTYYLSGGKMQWTSADATKTKAIGAVLSSAGAIQSDGEHNKVAYANAFLNTAVEYRAYSIGVKEVFVLSELPTNDGKIADSYLEYTGELTWDSGLSVWVDGIEYPDKTFTTNSSVDFKDVATNETVFSFLAPVAWDNLGSQCSAVYDVKVSAGKVQYGLRVPYSWLGTAVFPVTIDPSFTARTETLVDSYSQSSPYSLTITKPTNTAEDDILFALVTWYSTAGATIDSVPTDWTLAGEYLTNNDKYALYYKVAGGSEPADYTWSLSASCQCKITCSCYTAGDFDPADPIDVVSNTAYRTSDTAVKADSMTVSAADSPLVFFGAIRYSTPTPSFTKPSVPTADWVEDFDDWDPNPDFGHEVCSMVWTDSGATGVMSATASATLTAKHAFAVALNPAAACSPSISLNQTSWSVNNGNPVAASSTYETAINWCRITNNSGGTVNITIHGHDMTGGGYTWDLADDATPASMTYGLKAGLDDADDTFDIIIRETETFNVLVGNMADSATQDFGLKIWTPTAFNDGNQKSGNTTLTVACV